MNRRSLGEYVVRRRLSITGWVAVLGVAALAVVLFEFPLEELLTVGAAERAIRAATPIALAAIGGLYAEKSGVFNIGLEGFMIFGAVIAVAASWTMAGGAELSQTDLWIGVATAVLACTVFAALFAVLMIRYKADQIVAGLAVWFIGLGLGPYLATILWGQKSSPGINNIDNIVIPGLAELPILGQLLFDISPLVVLTFLLVAAAWVVLYQTRFGIWVQAAGEDPEALDTAGIDVNRVRYVAVIFSGAMAGLAGAALSVGIGRGFTGTGVTMVDGRGWIAIVAYLFGNYNPLGAFAASLLFGTMDMLQVQLQTIGIAFPETITGLFPYVAVLVVLTLVGYTRMPAAAGEPYEPEE